MSTARTVPETFELTGDDAWETLQATGRVRLLRDAFVRFRYADGFSHARALAFLLSLGLVQGTVALVGLAASVDSRSLSEGIVTAIRELAPGPAGRVLTQAVAQARDNGESGRYLAFAVTFAMGWTFHYSRSFGETYGPLAGIVALQLWCLLSSIGLLFGGAVAAQLEAVRAGAPAPRSGALDDSVGPPPPREPARRTATAGTLSA